MPVRCQYDVYQDWYDMYCVLVRSQYEVYWYDSSTYTGIVLTFARYTGIWYTGAQDSILGAYRTIQYQKPLTSLVF